MDIAIVLLELHVLHRSSDNIEGPMKGGGALQRRPRFKLVLSGVDGLSRIIHVDNQLQNDDINSVGL